MEELVLEASNELIARLAHEKDPVKAVIELIWNAIDAEAWNVIVTLERDPALDAIIAVRVEDDGHGISVDEVGTSFGRVGVSWKVPGNKSKNNVRAMHGSLGEGRLRAFALGNRVEWRSRSKDTVGAMYEAIITGSRSNRTVFHWDSSSIQPCKPETVFSAFNDEQKGLGALQPETAMSAIRSTFAPILLNEPKLRITYDDIEVDPAKEIVNDTWIEAPFTVEDNSKSVRLRIIEWQRGDHRAIYYGSDAEHFTFDESGTDVENDFLYSAYVIWSGLRDRSDYLQLGELAPEPLDELWKSARQTIREHFNERRRERRREQITKWQQSGIYPYEGEPGSEAEFAERTVFDIVSGTLSSQIPQKNKNSARLTLALLRDAIRHDPNRLTAILHEVVSLKAKDRDALHELLAETTLPAIIKSTNMIASRNKFLLALDHLLFDPTESSDVGERDHLHHLLERELWIFGEGYNMMNSERGLTQLLRTHLKLSGLPTRNVRSVQRWDGKIGRVDLHLAAKSREHDRVRHLIVELKAPGVEIGRTELDQVEDYGNAIVKNPQFRSAAAQWDIILVGTHLHDIARNRIHEQAFELGRFWTPAKPAADAPRVTCYVRRWRDIIDENRRRLDFLTSVMRHDPSLKEGIDYVRGRYADILPDGIGKKLDEQEDQQ